jgi:hypothetical protein
MGWRNQVGHRSRIELPEIARKRNAGAVQTQRRCLKRCAQSSGNRIGLASGQLNEREALPARLRRIIDLVTSDDFEVTQKRTRSSASSRPRTRSLSESFAERR